MDSQAIYRLGSSGAEVSRIQRKLQGTGNYAGPIDGIFGGATQSAVMAFQRARGAPIDGVVGPTTWRLLFELAGESATFTPPSILAEPPEKRCLALTGSFETGTGFPECFAGVTGDFDEQGLSLGVCQWNLGQRSLQPLLEQVLKRHDSVVRTAFQDHYDVLAAALASPQDELMAFARSIQDPRSNVNEPWRGMFKALARTKEFQDIQLEAAGSLIAQARTLSDRYELHTLRGLALMLDIKVQNGSISEVVRAQILRDYSSLPAELSGNALEVERLRIIANRRADSANPRWIEDVRTRKLCIANGGGRVHGIDYDLAQQYGIDLVPLS